MIKKKITLFCMLAVAHLALWAGKVISADTISVEFRYRQENSGLNPICRDNRSRQDSQVLNDPFA